MDEGAGDKRPGANEARGWADCPQASAGLSCERGSRQRGPGALGCRLDNAGVPAALQRLYYRPPDAASGVCVSVCLCECDD